MKNAQIWKQYQDYTKDVSVNARQLGFAAAAICWIFKAPQIGEVPSLLFPRLILWSLAFVVAFFSFDLLQLFLGAVLTRRWIRRAEKRLWQKTRSIEGEYHKPASIDIPVFILWCLKLLLLFLTFVLIGWHVLAAVAGVPAGIP